MNSNTPSVDKEMQVHSAVAELAANIEMLAGHSSSLANHLVQVIRPPISDEKKDDDSGAVKSITEEIAPLALTLARLNIKVLEIYDLLDFILGRLEV